MAKTTVQFIILFVILVLVQVIFSKIMLFNVATPIIFIYLLLRLPIGLSLNAVFTIAFFSGLSIDVFNDTQGMNAHDDESSAIIPSCKSIGTGTYLKYAGTLMLIYCFLIFFIQAFTFQNVLLTIARIFCSFALSLMLIYGIDSLVNTRREKR